MITGSTDGVGRLAATRLALFRARARAHCQSVDVTHLLEIGVECYAGHRGEQTPRTLILADRRATVAEVLDAWLAPDYRYFKLKVEDGDTYIVRHDEQRGLWELTMFRAERRAAQGGEMEDDERL